MTQALPWKVNYVRGQKRGQYTLWIEDANGIEVVPWIAFDDSDLGVTKQLAKARLIVKCVNAHGAEL